MTDDRDDEEAASGIPVRSVRSDSGSHGAAESGRHVTNRNVVSRVSVALERPTQEDTAEQRERNRPPVNPDDFDVVTPVLPQPRDVFVDEDATLSHGEELDAAGAQASGSDGAASTEPSAVDPRTEAIMARVRERLPRITPSPLGSAPHESRRPTTDRGHVEPRRRPTTPPPRLRSPDAPAERSPHDRVSDDADRVPTAPGRAAHAPTLDGVAPGLDRVLRVVTVLAVLGLGAAGLAQPSSVLRGGIAWLGFVFFALAGLGAIVARIARAGDLDVGLRAALGAAGYVALAGVALACGALSRPVILALIAAGAVGFAWRELTARVAIWQRVRDGVVFVRSEPALGVFVIALVLLACIRVLGATAAQGRSPEDDLAYLPFVRRLLDVGDLIEPFSARRLGEYGGQTALHALGAARGSLANLHLIDKGLGLILALLVMVGHARERRTTPLWLALTALVVLVLPDLAIDTASHWTGAVAFLALYRCAARAQWPLVGLTAAMTCTLRHSYLIPVAVFLACVLISRLITLTRTVPLREAWRHDRAGWAWAIGFGLALLAPWWLAAYGSSHTFLFPIVDGNWNHELSAGGPMTGWLQELASLVACALDGTPIAVIPLLAVVVAFATDRRPGRPLSSLMIAGALGLFAIVHVFGGGDPAAAWRPAFGFATALAIAIGLEIGADDDRVALAPLARWIALAAFVLQITVGRGALSEQLIARFDDIGEAAAIDRHGDPAARAELRRHEAMQAAIPAGARAFVMIDDPALLDHRRNALASVDAPGLASPARQLPAFRGAEALRVYLVAQGYRYAAFVRSARSRRFRRGFWIEQLFTGAEPVQIASAYTIDAIDSFAELATTTTARHDADGLVVLDLASPLRDASRRDAPGDESARRGAWVRALADREGLHDAWSLSTRADLRFEDGAGPLRFVDGSVDDPSWYDVTHARPEPSRRGQAIRPLARRVHLRIRGVSDMRLTLRAAIALHSVFSHPRLDVSLDGELLATAVADDGGRYAIDVPIARSRLPGGWHDLYLVFSSPEEPGRSAPDAVARLESIEWLP